MSLNARRLTPTMGIEVRDLDLAQPLGESLFAEIKSLWNQADGVLVVREQQLTEVQHIAFARHFGSLHRLAGHTVTKYLHPEHPEIYRVSNKSRDGKPMGRKGAGTYWHSDQSYEQTPAQASLLYALEIPPRGGDTIFCNMYKAYAALSEPMQRFLSGLTATHDFAVAQSGGFRNEEVTAEQLALAPPMSHPVVRRHDDTGRPCLFVNPGFTSHIDALAPEESRALLDFLYRHLAKPDFHYRHVWQPNDLVIWDNRCTMHYAVMDYDGQGERLMHRCTAIGEAPVAAAA